MHAPLDPIDDPEATTSSFLFGSGGAQRQVVSEAQLREYLSALIRGCEGCENVSVTETTRLDRPDESGCNWSSSLVLDPAGAARRRAQEVGVMETLRRGLEAQFGRK